MGRFLQLGDRGNHHEDSYDFGVPNLDNPIWSGQRGKNRITFTR